MTEHLSAVWLLTRWPKIQRRKEGTEDAEDNLHINRWRRN